MPTPLTVSEPLNMFEIIINISPLLFFTGTYGFWCFQFQKENQKDNYLLSIGDYGIYHMNSDSMILNSKVI